MLKIYITILLLKFVSTIEDYELNETIQDYSPLMVNQTQGINSGLCTVNLIIAGTAYRRKVLKYTQPYAVRFDKEDNLFVIFDEAYSNNEEVKNIKVAVLKKNNGYREDKLTIDPEAHPRAIDIDTTGRVLVATDQGLYAYDSFINKMTSYKLPNVDLLDVTVGPKNEIFVVENLKRTVNILVGDKLMPYHNLTSDFNLYVDRRHTVYIDDGWDTWYYAQNDKVLKKIKGAMAFTDMTTDIEGNIYAVNEKGLWRRAFGSHLFVKAKAFGSPASSVTVDSVGNIVIGAEEYVLILDKLGIASELKSACGMYYKIEKCLLCNVCKVYPYM